MKQLIQAMAAQFARQEAFAMATVITRNGSAPRSAGAKMMVRADGSSTGTVGGGILEAQVQQLAAEILQQHRAVVQKFEFSGADAATMDAICGGRVEVLVEWWDAADPNLKRISEELQIAVEQHGKAWLLTTLPSADRSSLHTVVRADGQTFGAIDLAVETFLDIRQPELIHDGEQQIMVEPIDIAGSVYIFGAGHVSRSLASFTKAVGFWTVILDDRPEYANWERFPNADEIIVPASYQDVFEKIAIGPDSFIVIVTRGHLNDREVLAQALQTQAGYIGMIGSRRKCALVFDELLKTGCSEEDIHRVHAPIGLAIDAETPEEIGISITAEMIQVRARLLKHP